MSESQAERKHSESLRASIEIGLFFGFCLRLRQSSFHRIIGDGVLSGIGRKLKRSDSSDSVVFMTLRTTLIFDFYMVVSALTTPSLGKTSVEAA